jgi:hypothetical protein
MFGRGQRSELDEEEAAVLAGKLRDETRKEMARVERGKLWDELVWYRRK